jgi:AP-1 complex subunit mu
MRCPADAEVESELKPVLQEGGLTLTYITHNGLYLLAVSRTNINAVATLYFLHRLVDVFKYYFEAS